ncbi:fruit protein pKIWI502-like isoform X2 [Magnolia sinica]|uniref:fruit protein pKIWI502-like isoform X2 n=1 Tax=Magnolia sinica TaxID=86752 RepID=UPI00265B28F4|nr:fruit protein pKIWI502-like isoform X2 [Magnolia sinica]
MRYAYSASRRTCYSTVRSWAAAAETNPSKPSRRQYCPSLPTFPCHPMAIMRHLNLHRFSSLSNALRQCPNTTPWAPAPISLIHHSSESLFHVAIDVSDHPDLINSHAWPGQYLQLRLPHALKPVFLAIASPPSLSASTGEFEFLVKSVTGSTAEALCRLRRGDVVELSSVMGRGFDMEEISPPEVYPTVLIFATGSGVSPIRSLIESGFGADRRSDVRLYYGAKNLRRMAYQDRFKGWESSGVRIIPVLSQPDSGWQGERGYVQAAFARAKQISNPLGTGVVVCGCRQMAEERHFVKFSAVMNSMA